MKRHWYNEQTSTSKPTRGNGWVNSGDPVIDPDFAAALGVGGTRLFLYGKRGPRAGRKMGHLAAIGDSPADALRRVQRAASLL